MAKRSVNLVDLEVSKRERSLIVALRRLPDSTGKLELSIQGPSVDLHTMFDGAAFSQSDVLEYLPNGEQVTDQPLLQGNRLGTISRPFTGAREGDILLMLVLKK